VLRGRIRLRHDFIAGPATAIGFREMQFFERRLGRVMRGARR